MAIADRLREIHLYHEGTAPALDPRGVAEYLAETTGCREVRVHGSFLLEHTEEEERPALARRLAALKVLDIDAPWREREPAHMEVEFERRRLARGDRGPHGVAYEGFQFQATLRDLIAPRPLRERRPRGRDSLRLSVARIILTNRLMATWGEDRRYHLRTILLGLPAIISTSGLVEAPAKPREFYLAQQQLGGRPSEEAIAALKQRFRGRFLDHDDPRLTEVVKGYAMQAVAYLLTGEAFCEDPECRLFNAHWQEEMLRAQTGDRYCQRHARWLEALRASL